jgi:hypothetical protein
MKFIQDITNGLAQGGNFIDKLHQNQNYLGGISAFNPQGGQRLMDQALFMRQQQEGQRQQEAHEMKKNEALRSQQLAKALPQLLNQIDITKPNDALKALGAAGVPPKEALTLLKQIQDLNDTKVEDKFNPVTGELVRFQNKLAQGNTPQQQGQGNFSQQMAGGNQAPQNPFGNTPIGQKLAFEEDLKEKAEDKKVDKKFLDETSQAAVEGSKLLNKLDIANKLLDKFYQGPFAGEVKTLGQAFSTKGAKAAEAFDAIVSQVVIDLSTTLKGTQSDNDMARIELTKPAKTNTEEGNGAIVQQIDALTNRAVIQYNKAAQEFIGAGGNGKQFRTRWSQYANAFPLINDDSTVNYQNQTLWQDVIFRPDNEFDAIINAAKPVTETLETPFGNYTLEQLEGR